MNCKLLQVAGSSTFESPAKPQKPERPNRCGNCRRELRIFDLVGVMSPYYWTDNMISWFGGLVVEFKFYNTKKRKNNENYAVLPNLAVYDIIS